MQRKPIAVFLSENASRLAVRELPPTLLGLRLDENYHRFLSGCGAVF